jgi:UDP-N-acetylglucosamine 2-epimerase (non-hydrolysing)
MKIAPLMRRMRCFTKEIKQVLVHTGQHYDENMSKIFFEQLELPLPDINLEVGSGSHAWQTAQVMLKFEPVVLDWKPDWVIVVGDVNSTLACTLVCSKLGIRVAHVESGLRSFDRTMPEEINRLITDQLSDCLFTPSLDGNDNLLHEGIDPEKIHFVGNIMIDTLIHLMPKIETRSIVQELGLNTPYILVTLHRPSNVDNPQTLTQILLALQDISKQVTVIFPVHPRTQLQTENLSIISINNTSFRLIEPLGYLDFVALQKNSALVITDSGGVQEETTYLKIPCLTVRPNTERPVTIINGSNQLVNSTKEELVSAVEKVLHNPRQETNCPELWDGKTSQRIIEVLRHYG